MGFACIYIPDFLLQAVVRGQRSLGDGALALLGGTPPLWSVVAANSAAFHAGIQLGMTKAQVTQFASEAGVPDSPARPPQVQICMRSEAQEQAAHAALLDTAWSISPRVEDTAPDTLVLDLQGLTTLFGSEEKVAQELACRIAKIGLAARIAVAANIETAIHAARGFPGITIIPPGEKRRRLGSLPLGVLTAEPETLDILERWGVSTLQALAALPVLQLSERLGQEGVRLSELARGARRRSLLLAQPSASFAEEMELEDAVEELEPLSFLLGRLLDRLCVRLDARALSVRAVYLRFELQPSFEKDFQVREEARKKPEPKHYRKVLSLPVPIRSSKTLLKLLRLQLQSDLPPAPIQKIRMTADAAAPRVTQNGLFAPAGPDPEKLELTIARLAKLVGQGNVGRVHLEDSHRPESFRLEHFAASAEQSRRGTALLWPRKPSATNAIAVGALRIIRPPEAVRVELRNAQPARVYFRGVRGEVMAASGPWRSSGDWWQEDPWQHDEWDLEIEFSSPVEAQHRCAPSSQEVNLTASQQSPPCALYRIYFDSLRQSWFLRGIYD
ncbi:MAG TPA: DNA polymerase Y family protein [Candidatus Acidoferrum sp.]|nr:DNA polymerase Y family protein [Candidatus Acidoferrum sp.]